mmetsp:Transcript_6286/g.39115  ORF Transcript_6286/g.39115 Transcript_6286/m.39115 type:complete len:221 (+) Transcript_6286:1215-1877(+)
MCPITCVEATSIGSLHAHLALAYARHGSRRIRGPGTSLWAWRHLILGDCALDLHFLFVKLVHIPLFKNFVHALFCLKGYETKASWTIGCMVVHHYCILDLTEFFKVCPKRIFGDRWGQATNKDFLGPNALALLCCRRIGVWLPLCLHLGLLPGPIRVSLPRNCLFCFYLASVDRVFFTSDFFGYIWICKDYESKPTRSSRATILHDRCFHDFAVRLEVRT